jgi:lysozyme
MKTRIKVFGRTLKRFVKKPAALLIGGIALGMAGYFSAIFKKEKEEIDEIGGEEDTPVISETPLEKSPEVSKPVEEKNPPAEEAKGTPTKTETAQAPISGQVRTESGGGLVTSEGAPVMTGEQEQKPSSTSTPAPPKAGTPTKEPSKKPEEKIAAPISAGDDKSTMDMIKTHEGVRTKPYKDSVGLWTIGVGHLIGDGKTLPPEWNREFTMSEIDKLFMQDYEHHKKAAEKIPAFDKLNKMGQAALIDLTFNMGPAWYKKWPTLMKQLLAGDFQGAADNLKDSTWYKQVKNRGVTIVNLIRNAGEKNTEIVKSKSSSGSTLASAGPTEYDKNKETKVNVIVSSKTNIKTNNIEEPRKAA